jgi:hypothetical protein
MWNLLLLGLAGVGAYAIYKHLSDEEQKGDKPKDAPPPPEPPSDVINVSASSAKSFYGQQTDELVWVTAVAKNFQRPADDLTILQHFPSQQAAMEFADKLAQFFRQSASKWTCPAGSGFAYLWAGGFVPGKPPMATLAMDTWSECEQTPVDAGGSLPPTTKPEKPVFIVNYDIRSGLEDSRTFVFGSNADAEAFYAQLNGFFTDPAIRSAYTWPAGTVSIMKYGTKPAQSRYTLVDESGIVVES